MEERVLHGRDVLYTDYETVTRENVVEVLLTAVEAHSTNQTDIDYLYRYYKGEQPILSRERDVRPEINYRVVENRANEIVSFKVGHLMGEPLQYVSRSADSGDDISLLNENMFVEDKPCKDKELAEWFCICGTSYRMVLPKDEETPFEIFTLDPRYTFVVYHNGLGNKPVMGVKFVVRADDKTVYSVYTDENYFEIIDEEIVKEEAHFIGSVPITEYPHNSSRLGSFEIVLPLLNAINAAISNRLNAVEQFVQAFLVLKGADIDEEEFTRLKELGGILIPKDGEVEYLTQELNQTQTQTLADHLYQTMLTICGMPNRNGGSSTSDTGKAVIMRDGWSAAEARAKDTELVFKRSESVFLKTAIRIMNSLSGTNLKLSDIEMRFTRRNYENILEKTQVFTMMLANEKCDPYYAFANCGLFSDPDTAYKTSMEHYEEYLARTVKDLELFAEAKNV